MGLHKAHKGAYKGHIHFWCMPHTPPPIYKGAYKGHRQDIGLCQAQA